MSETTPTVQVVTTYRPDEMLTRWDYETGLPGTHCRFWEVQSIEGLGVISKKLTDPLTPDQAAKISFPFKDVLAQLEADALVRVAQLEAAMAEKERELASLKEAHQAELAASQATTQALLAELETAKALAAPEAAPATI